MNKHNRRGSQWNPTDNPMLTGVRGLCPRCQRGHLFRGYLSLAKGCEVCELDLFVRRPRRRPGVLFDERGCYSRSGFCALASDDIRAGGLGPPPHDLADHPGGLRALASSAQRMVGLLAIFSQGGAGHDRPGLAKTEVLRLALSLAAMRQAENS